MKLVKGYNILVCIVALTSTSTAFATKTPSTEAEKISYSLGAVIGKQFKTQDFNFQSPLFIEGFQDTFHQKKTQLSEAEMSKTLTTFQETQNRKRREAYEALATKNQKASQDFLAQNKTKKGIITLDSGLQYKVIQPGKGRQPKAEETVKVHYKGTLIDGTKFDSSYDRNKPATFPVSGVISGWSQALQLMKPGAKWTLYIPPQLAYGAQGIGNKIGPNMALIFEVELLSIEQNKEGEHDNG